MDIALHSGFFATSALLDLLDKLGFPSCGQARNGSDDFLITDKHIELFVERMESCEINE